MPLVSMRQLLDHAAENGYGLPAFNVNNMEQVWAIMEAAAQVDGALAHLGAGPVVLMHHQRNLRIGLHGGLDEVLDEAFPGVLARPGAGLQDNGRTDFGRRRHHRLNLLEVVHVEGRNPVAVLSGVVEQLAHGNERHGDPLFARLKKRGVTAM